MESTRDYGHFVVTKFSDIRNKVIPFFDKYKIEGVKSLDFEDWYKVAKIIETKGHLTKEGLDRIRNIKAGMNQRRKLDV